MTSERPIEFGPAPLEKVSMVIETWPQLHSFIRMLVEMLETVYLQGIIRGTRNACADHGDGTDHGDGADHGQTELDR